MQLQYSQRRSTPTPFFHAEVVKSVPVASIVKLYKAGGWWEEGSSQRRSIPQMVKNSFAFAIARNRRGDIIGMSRVISDGVSDAYIQDVVVLPGYRGKGIGATLVKTLTDYCRRKKIPWVGLVAEPGTYPFYRKLGFKDKKGFQLMLL
ncbi:MAG: GNAT family N-acetyltransferase, partial [Proteobacteria bacterium]|nr:GNAT family N-acetyltransferase [Pseudomonadota bacterium]